MARRASEEDWKQKKSTILIEERRQQHEAPTAKGAQPSFVDYLVANIFVDHQPNHHFLHIQIYIFFQKGVFFAKLLYNPVPNSNFILKYLLHQ
jgi:hypothetical protein